MNEDFAENLEKSPNLNAFTWTALNPFEESTSYLLLTPADAEAAAELRVFADQIGLKHMSFGGDIPWVGTDDLCVALRGVVADLLTGDRSWLKVPASDVWTGNAIARRYIVLVVGTVVTEEELDGEQLSAYLRGDTGVNAGLVKIRLRVTDQ